MKYNLPNGILRFAILAMVMMATFTMNGGSKYYSYHLIEVKPTGSGLVYSTASTENGANTNFNACTEPPYRQNWHTGNSTNTLYLLAKPKGDYVFSHWEDQKYHQAIPDK